MIIYTLTSAPGLILHGGSSAVSASLVETHVVARDLLSAYPPSIQNKNWFSTTIVS